MPHFYRILQDRGYPTTSLYTHSLVYGPFDSAKEAQEHFQGLGQSDRFALLFEAELMASEREDSEKREASCSEENFTERGGRWYCNECNCVAMGATIYHPIWDAKMRDQGVDGVGNGEVHVEKVPYCPRCEQQPASNGAPIYR